jgi:hypothetical protein
MFEACLVEDAYFPPDVRSPLTRPDPVIHNCQHAHAAVCIAREVTDVFWTY